ncbi:MAG TPA: shikimate dehydrogenase, partial [Chloroflexia bacterium]|nr:shikimate dehydrogenase [Chloroflexia bacterium]
LGCNVTVPYKTAIAPLLDELHGDAAALGAVNTVRVEAGRLAGYNTDVAGFAADLAAHLPAGATPGRAVVLGAGGSARAVVWALARQGWEVVVVARRAAQAAQLRESLPGGVTIIPAALEPPILAGWLAGARLLVNCTPAGMWPRTADDPLPPDVPLPADLFVYDLVYRPAQTRLLARAAAAGCRTAGGLGMLVGQGAAAFTLWTGQPAPVAIMRAAAEQALAAQHTE